MSCLDSPSSCYWVQTGDGPILIPGCFGAIAGGAKQCECAHDESNLRIRVADAHRILSRLRTYIPGAKEALALVGLEAEPTMSMEILLTPIRTATATPGTTQAGDRQWLIDRLAEKQIEPKSTVAQMERRRPRPWKEKKP